MNELQQLRDEITQLQTALTIKNGAIEQLKARVAELEAQQASARQVPEGWQLVPLEPTKDMVAAALCGDDDILDPYKLVVADYKAMLAAAPQAERAGGES